MSSFADNTSLNPKIVAFYHEHLNNFGDSAKGVGWKDDLAQETRFDQLLKIIEPKKSFSINDLGCGVGRLYHYMRNKNFGAFSYNGYDMVDEMIQKARENKSNGLYADFKTISSSDAMTPATYSVASGIFNVKYDIPEDQWLAHILVTLDHMNQKSTSGFAFNCLTSYSDKEYMQSYLYYANPLSLFDYCKKTFSKNVALLHDYDQYDFTIIVKKKGKTV